MSSSVSRSSSRRATHRSPSTPSSLSKDRQHGEISGKKVPLRRSRSMAAFPGSSGNRIPEDLTECTSMRDNPLFDCSSSSPSPTGIEFRSGTTEDDVLDFRRGRSMLRHSNFRNGSSHCQSECGRSLSRDVTGRRRLRSLPRGYNGVFKNVHWEDKISSDSFYEAEDFSTENYFQSDNLSTDLGIGEIYEAVQFKVHSAASESITNIENAVKRSPSIISRDSIVNIPAEFVNPDAIELVSDIRREYSIKLEQSQERIRKLQADLAVEEQCHEELSKILENIVRYPKSFESQAKKKASIERIKISRRLAEEAMNYFDECVSLSTFDDGSDFSSLEDQHTGSNFGVNPTGNSRFFSNGCSNSSAFNHPHSQLEHLKDTNSDNKCTPSIAGSNYESIRNCSSEAADLIPHNVHDDLPELNKRSSSGSSLLYACERPGSVGLQEIRSYIRKFEKKGKSKCVEDDKRSSSYNAKDHASNSSDEALLFEKVMLRNRTHLGGVLVCEIRTF